MCGECVENVKTRGRDAVKDVDYLTSHMSDWMIRSIVAGTITAARGGFKTPRGARTERNLRRRQ